MVAPVPVPAVDGDFLDRRFALNLFTDPLANVSMTKQSFRDEVDVNSIVARFIKTGLLPVLDGQPFFGDVSSFPDYQTAMNEVVRANALFAQMPANIRNKFNNDPGEMLNFLADPANLQEALDLGIVQAKPDGSTPPAVTPVVTPAVVSTPVTSPKP